MTKRVLIALDGSEASQRALEVACRWAKALGALVDAVSVIDLSGLDVYDGFYMTDDQLSAVEEKFQSSVLDQAQKTASAMGVDVRTRLLKGHASKLLLEEADEEDVEMIVVGRTGKNFLDRVVLGSVSQRLSASAACPVVIVR